jgi:hypothetical protein
VCSNLTQFEHLTSSITSFGIRHTTTPAWSIPQPHPYHSNNIQYGSPRLDLLQDKSQRRLRLRRAGKMLMWKRVCSALHLRQGFQRELDSGGEMLVPYVLPYLRSI